MAPGVIRIIHHLPGRMRLYIGEIRFRPERAAHIAALPYSPEQRPAVSQPGINEEDCLPYRGMRQ